MAVSNTAFRIIRKAVAIRVKNGEQVKDIVEDYPKLSPEQKQALIDEFSE